jgi:hypothetical protein
LNWSAGGRWQEHGSHNGLRQKAGTSNSERDGVLPPPFFKWWRAAEAPLWNPNPFQKPVAMPRFSDILMVPFHPVNRRLNRANGSIRVELTRLVAQLVSSKSDEDRSGAAAEPQEHQILIPCSAGWSAPADF